jgi:adenosylcobinamide kinase / adenosylcobinamide-phosphate guanylyltransferase
MMRQVKGFLLFTWTDLSLIITRLFFYIDQNMKELILGGARSGKSGLAERLAGESGQPVIYLATASAGDAEMTERIQHHRERRPQEWSTVEEPLYLSKTLQQHASDQHLILVDCLTLWLTNLLLHEDKSLLKHECAALLELLPQLPGRIIMVSNEVGMGIVPMGEISRQFQDEAGWLHQALAAVCDRVVFTVAGLPQVLKGDKL